MERNTIVKLLQERVKIGVAKEITRDRLRPSEAGDRVRGQTMQDVINHGRDMAFSFFFLFFKFFCR